MQRSERRRSGAKRARTDSLMSRKEEDNKRRGLVTFDRRVIALKGLP
jgi:hypothetical protein